MEDAEQVVSHAPPGGWAAVVVDHYCLSRPWENRAFETTRRASKSPLMTSRIAPTQRMSWWTRTGTESNQPADT